MTPRNGKIVCFGEMLVRLSTEPHGPDLAHGDRLNLHIGGAEANVAVALASLGHESTMVTALPEGALGDRGIVHLRAFGVDTTRIVRGAGRLGLYFVDTGASLRPSQVVYDRAGSLFVETDWSSFDWESVLRGASLLHVSGIALAVGQHTRIAAIRAMTVARALGAAVSFDGNYRASLWSGREQESAKAVAEALMLADIVFADHRDAALVLGRNVPSDAGSEALLDAFPALSVVAQTTRQIASVENHLLGARVVRRDGVVGEVPARQVSGVVDRIGGGDAFAAGVLHAWLDNGDVQNLAETGWAAGCLKHSQRGDALIVTRDMLKTFDSTDRDIGR